ncbi:hypothetical protein Tco_1074472 [Tanacetum coccineum]
MDDPNITMKEYIRLEEEKARRCAITLIDEISSEKTLSCEPTVNSLNNEVDFRISFDDSDDEDHTSNTVYPLTWIRHMALRPQDQRHQYLRYEVLQYIDADIADFEERLGMIYSSEIHWVQVVDFQGMPELMRDALYDRIVRFRKNSGN